MMMVDPFLNHYCPPRVQDSWFVDVYLWHGATESVGGFFLSLLVLVLGLGLDGFLLLDQLEQSISECNYLLHHL